MWGLTSIVYDMKTNKNILLTGIVGVIVVGCVIWWLFLLITGSGGSGLMANKGVEGEPLDLTIDYYERWMSARNASTTDPFAEGLQNDPILSENVQNMLSEYEGKLDEAERDPVLCQTSVPDSLRTLKVSQDEDKAQILVLSATKGLNGQATIDLEGDNGHWLITNIKCTSAEENPNQGEYSFDKEGYLLKNVPAPLDSNYWHIVYKQDDVAGYTAPLHLDASSTCVNEDGTEQTCNTDMFTETGAVHVQGDMTESGVNVARIEFINSQPF